MNKKELIERIECLKNLFGNKSEYIEKDMVIRLISELDEPQKVTVPQFVAEWIENGKKELSLRDLMSRSYTTTEVGDWLGELDEDGGFKNQETFARAVLDGYEIEEEKRYFVKLKNIDDYLNTTETGFHFYNKWRNNETFTRKELEEADFGWVFDCPGIEIEEVE